MLYFVVEMDDGKGGTYPAIRADILNEEDFAGKKPEGIAVELADCIIRILDYLGKERVDIDRVVAENPDIEHTRNKAFGEFICGCHYLLSLSYQHKRAAQKNDDPVYLWYLAGCITDILDWARVEGVDMEKILDIKHEYNKGRPYRHGGKAL